MTTVIESSNTWQDLVFRRDDITHSTESDEHYEKKIQVARQLLEEGYQVSLEHRLDELPYIVDVIGVDGDDIVVYEVGYVQEDKHEELSDNFKNYRHVGYNKDGELVKSVRSTGDKKNISLSIDQDTLERMDNVPGTKRSTLFNEVMDDWLDENGY